jgi:hypothetical protein
LFRDAQPVEVAASTAEHGVFAFLLGDRTPYSLRGACALASIPMTQDRANMWSLGSF